MSESQRSQLSLKFQAMATLSEGMPANTSTMPLASRLDHLDFVMKYLGGKQENVPRFVQNGSSSSSSVQGQKKYVPKQMDVVAKETYSKGILMDRVASIEHRLVQLCLAMDSESPSTSDTLSAQEPQRKTSRSFGTLNSLREKKVKQQALVEGPETQEKYDRVLNQKLKRRSYLIQPLGKKNGSQQKSEKKGLKRWSPFSFLGC